MKKNIRDVEPDVAFMVNQSLILDLIEDSGNNPKVLKEMSKVFNFIMRKPQILNTIGVPNIVKTNKSKKRPKFNRLSLMQRIFTLTRILTPEMIQALVEKAQADKEMYPEAYYISDHGFSDQFITKLCEEP